MRFTSKFKSQPQRAALGNAAIVKLREELAKWPLHY